MRRSLNLFVVLLISLLSIASEAFAQAEPSTQARFVGISQTTSTSVRVSWFRGNGMKRLLVVKAGANPFAADELPVDGAVATVVDANFSNAGNQQYIGVAGAADKGVAVYSGFGTNVTVTGLSAGTRYTFFVLEYNALPNGTNPNYILTTSTLNPRSFSTPVTAPNITASTPTASTCTIDWSDAGVLGVSGGGYILQVATDAAFTSVLLDYDQLDMGNVQSDMLIENLTQGTNYYWRVKAYLNGTQSNWSLLGSFATTVDNTAPTVTALDLFEIGTPGIITVAEAAANDFGATPQAGLDIRITYSETMDVSGANDPTVAFTPDVLTSPDVLDYVGRSVENNAGTNNAFRYYYTILNSADEQADVDVAVTGAKDPAGNLQTPFSVADKFDVDQKAPVVSDFTVSCPAGTQPCIPESETITFTFKVVEEGGGTFNGTNIVASLDPGGMNNALVHSGGSPTGTGTVADPYIFTYTLATINNDNIASQTFRIVATDAASNTTGNVDNANAFQVDDEAPIVEAVARTVGNACEKSADQITFTVQVQEPSGCGTFDENDITIAFVGGPYANAPVFVGPVAGDGADGTEFVLTYTWLIDAADPAGDVQINVTAIDDANQSSGAYGPTTITSIDKTVPATSALAVAGGNGKCKKDGEGDPFTITFDATDIGGCGTFDENDITVTTNPAANVTVTYNSDDGTTYTYDVDIAGVAAEGSYEIIVNATDDAGNAAAVLSLTNAFYVDKSVPTFSNYAINTSCVKLGADVVVDLDITNANCDITDAMINISSTSTVDGDWTEVITNPSAGVYHLQATYTAILADAGAQEISIVVTDEANNADTYAPAATPDFFIDNTLPVIDNVSLTNGGCLKTGDLMSISFEVDEIAAQRCGTLDATNITFTAPGLTGTFTTGAPVGGNGEVATPYTFLFNYTVQAGDTPGDIDITINVTDAAGNVATSVNANAITIDNVAPLLSNLVIKKGVNVETCFGNTDVIDVYFDAVETGCGTFDNTDITVAVTGPSAVTLVYQSKTLNTYKYQVAFAGQNSGDYHITVDADDDSGNSAIQLAPAPAEFSIDVIAPALSAFSIGATTCGKETTEVSFSFKVVEEGCLANTFDHTTDIVFGGLPAGNGVMTYVNKTGAGTAGSPWTYFYKYVIGSTDVSGAYDFTITATDASGNSNVAYDPAGSEFTVDNTAPIVDAFAETAAACITTGDVATFTFNVEEQIANRCAGLTTGSVAVVWKEDGNVFTPTVAPVITITAGDGDDGTEYAYQVVWTVNVADPEGAITVDITATDGVGLTHALNAQSLATVDKTLPVLATLAVTGGNGKCKKDAVGDPVIITFSASEIGGCGAFDNTDIVVTTVPALANNFVHTGTAGTTFTYSLNLDAGDADGSIEIKVNATDDAGNVATELALTDAFYIDAAVPTFANYAIDKTCIALGVKTTVDIDITEASICALTGANVAITGTTNGDADWTKTLTGTAPTYHLKAEYTGLVADAGNVDFVITVTDEATNAGVYTPVASPDFVIDDTDPSAPGIALVGPPANDCYKDAQEVDFTVTVTEAGCGTFDENDVIVSVTGGMTAVYQSKTAGPAHALTYKITIPNSTPDATYTITATASDDAGNGPIAQAVAETFVVDNTAPLITDYEITTGACAGTGATIGFTVDVTEAGCGTLSGVPGDGEVTFTFSPPMTNTPVLTGTAGTYVYTYTLLVDAADANNDYQMTVNAQDDLGNVATPFNKAGVEFTIDKTAPSLGSYIYAGPKCLKETDEATFTIAAFDNVNGCGTFDENDIVVKANGATTNVTFVSKAPPTYTYKYTVPAANDGAINITVDATDDGGNASAQMVPGGDEWYIDNTLPTIANFALTAPPAGNCYNAGQTITYTFEVTEQAYCACAGCGFDQNDLNVVTAVPAAGGAYANTPVFSAVGVVGNVHTFTYTLLVDAADPQGDVNFAVQATDDAGNVSLQLAANAAASIDKTAPVLANLTIVSPAGTCFKGAPGPGGNVITITVDATDDGCGTYDENDITVTLTGQGALSGGVLATYASKSSDTYTFTFPLLDSHPNGAVNISVSSTDDSGNNTVLNPGGNEFYIDNTAPVFSALTYTGASTCLAQADLVKFTVNVVEEGCGSFTADDMTITLKSGGNPDITIPASDFQGKTGNGSVANPWVYTYNHAVTGAEVSAAYDIEVTGTDDALNAGNTLTAAAAFTIDNADPVVNNFVVTGGAGCKKPTDVVTVTFGATDVGCGTFDVNDLTVEVIGQAAMINTPTKANTGVGTYQSTYTVDAGDPAGDVTFKITATDDAGNSFVFTSPTAFTIDNTAPVLSDLTIAPVGACYKVGQEITMTFKAVEGGCGTFNGTDITIGGTAIAGAWAADPISGAGSAGNPYIFTYKYTVQAGDNEVAYNVTIDANDDAMNAAIQLAPVGDEFTIDKTAPTVTVPSMTNTSPFKTGQIASFTFNATDAGCGTFDENDFTVELSNGGTIGNTVNQLSKTPIANGFTYIYGYTVLITDTEGNVTVKVKSATDDAGNVLADVTANNLFCIDATKPTLSNLVVTSGDCANNGDVVEFTVDVVEAGCGTFDETDFSVTLTGTNVVAGAAVPKVGNPVGTGTYTFQYTVDGDDAGSVAIAIDATDASGNAADQLTGTSFTVDNTVPVLASFTITSVTCLGGGQDLVFTVDASDVGCGTFDKDDITIAIAGPAALANIGTPTITNVGNVYTYTYDIDNADTDGDYQITVDAQDDAGNNAVQIAPAGVEFVIDNTKPVLTNLLVTGAPICAKAATDVMFTFDIAEAGCGTFDKDDITVTLVPTTGSLTNAPVWVSGTGAGTYTYKYTVHASDVDCGVDIKVNATDDGDNVATELTIPGSDFSIDNNGPVFSSMAIITGGCVSGGNSVRISFDAVDAGCASFDHTNMTFTTPGPAAVANSFVHNAVASVGDNYVFDLLIDNADVSGDYNVTVTGADALGNTGNTLNPAPVEFVVDNSAPTIASVNVLPSKGDCVMPTETVLFNVVASDIGCGTLDNTNITVTLTGTAALGNAHAFINEAPTGQFNYSYIVAAGDPEGDVDISVSITDDAGKGPTTWNEAGAEFVIDKTAPVLNTYNFVSSSTCVKGGAVVVFEFNVAEAGCGTFDKDDLTVTLTGQLPGLVGAAPTYVSGGPGTGTYRYQYIVHANDPSGAVNLQVTATDDAGNIATPLTPAGDEFEIDNTDPVISTFVAPTPSCYGGGDNVVFKFDVTEAGCGTFNAADITYNITGGVLANVGTINTVGVGDTYTATLAIDAGDPSGDYNIEITATDDAGNTHMLSPVGDEFSVDNSGPVLSNMTITAFPCSADGDEVTIAVDAVDLGCATFDQTNITVNVTGTGAQNGSVAYVSNTANTYTFKYTVGSLDADGDYQVTIDAVDAEGNNAVQLTVGGPEFVVDNTHPVLNNWNYLSSTCVNGGTTVEFTINAADIACGTFNVDDLSATSMSPGPVATQNAISFTHVAGNSYKGTLLIDNADIDGNVDVIVKATDDAGNETVLDDTAIDFNIDNTAPVFDQFTITSDVCLKTAEEFTFTFRVTEAGCGTFTHGANLNVTTNPATANAPVYVSDALGIFTYKVVIAAADAGKTFNVMIDGNDPAGNTAIQLTPAGDEFTADGVLPMISNFNEISDDCLNGGDEYKFSFEVVEEGCGTFNASDLAVTTIPALTNAPVVDPATPMSGTGTVADPYLFTYKIAIVGGDSDGAKNIKVVATDDAGNVSADFLPAGDEFVIDNTDPTANTLAITPGLECVTAGDEVTFTFNVVEEGCDTFDQTNLVVTTSPVLAAGNPVFVNVGGTGNPYTFTYKMPIGVTDVENDVNIIVNATDPTGNTMTELNPGGTEFVIDRTAPDITAVVVQGDNCLSLGDNLVFRVSIVEEGCGTFNKDDITITTSPVLDNLNQNPVLIGGTGAVATPYVFEYTFAIAGGDLTQAYDIIVNANDDAGNAAPTWNNAGTEFNVDNLDPTITNVAYSSTCVKGGTTVVVTFDLNDIGCGNLDQANISATTVTGQGPLNAGANLNYVSGPIGPNNTFTYNYLVDADDPNGEVYVSIEATDDAGNTKLHDPLGAEFVIDNVNPALGPLAYTGDACVDGPVTVSFTITATDAGCGTFNQTDLTVTATGTAAQPVYASTSGDVYTYNLDVAAADADGLVNITVNATDDAGNSPAAFVENAVFIIDNNAPVLSAINVTPPTCVKAGTLVAFTVVATENGCGSFDENDITVKFNGNATLTNAKSFVNEAPAHNFNYTILVDAADEGAVNITVDATDASGNVAPTFDPAGAEFTVDATSPVFSNLTVTPTTCVNGADVIEVKFDVVEDGCGTFDNTDITPAIAPGVANTLTYKSVSGTGTGADPYKFVYDLIVVGGDADGIRNISFTGTDDATNAFNFAPAGAEFQVDNTKPVVDTYVAISSKCLKGGQNLVFTVDVAETGCGVFNKDSLKVNITGPANLATAPVVTGPSGTTYTITQTINGADTDGDYEFTFTAIDGTGNVSTVYAPAGAELTVDNTTPIVSNLVITNGGCVKDADVINIKFDIEDAGCGTFDDAARYTIGSSPVLTGGNMVYSGITNIGPNKNTIEYTYTVAVGDSDAATNLTISMTDPAGNVSNTLNPAGAEFTIDKIAPTVANLVMVSGTCASQGKVVEFTFDATETGCGVFDENDLTVELLTQGPVTLNTVYVSNNGSGKFTYKYITLGTENNGDVTINVTAIDDATNSSGLVQFAAAFQFDNADPVIASLQVDEGGTVCFGAAAEVDFSFDVTDPVFNCGGELIHPDNVTVTLEAGVGAMNGTLAYVNKVGDNLKYKYTVSPLDNTADVKATIVAIDDAGNEVTTVNNNLFSIDNVKPVMSTFALVDAGDACVKGPENVDFTFVVTESGCGTFDQADITVTATSTGGALTGGAPTYVSNAGNIFTYRYAVQGGDPSGLVNITMQGTDDVGNIGDTYAPVGTEFVIDNAAPVISSVTVTAGACATDGDEVFFNVVATDVNTCGTFDQNDLTITIAGVAAAASFIDESPTDQYNYKVAIAAGDVTATKTINVSATDDSSNGPTVHNTTTFAVDNTDPILTSVNTVGSTCVKDGDEFTFNVITNDPTGCGTYDQNDITVTIAGVAAPVTYVDHTPPFQYNYKVAIAAGDATGAKTINVSVTDDKGNGPVVNNATTFNVDNTAPVITSVTVTDNACSRATDEVKFSVVSTDIGCGTYDQNDITVTIAGVTNAVAFVDEAPANQYNYKVLVDAGDATGTKIINVSVIDDATNGPVVHNTTTFEVDNTNPVVSNLIVTENSCLGPNQVLTFKFDATDVGCGAFGTPNLVITPSGNGTWNGSFANTDVTGNTFTYTYTPSGNELTGAANISIQATDEAGNMSTHNPAGDEITYDLTAPAISAFNMAVSECRSAGQSVIFEFVVTENGCGTFDASDITIGGLGTLANTATNTGIVNLGAGQNRYIYAVDLVGADPEGNYNITVSTTDDAGNVSALMNPAGDEFSIDKTAAVLSDLQVTGGPNPCVSGGGTINFTFKAVEENGCGTFDNTKITVGGTGTLANNAVHVSTSGAGTVGNPYLFTYKVDIVNGDPDGVINLTVNATDAAGNASVELNPVSDEFTVDNDAPVLSSFNVTSPKTCVKAGETIVFTFNAVEQGCGTFDKNDITIGGLVGFAAPAVNQTGNGTVGVPYLFTYTYTAPVGINGAINITVDAQDDQANNSVQLNPAGDEFTVDNIAPVFSNMVVTANSCAKNGEIVTFKFNVVEEGCGTFDHTDIVFGGLAAIAGVPAHTGTIGTGTAGDPYVMTFNLGITGIDPSGDYNITVDANDDAGNSAAQFNPAGNEFVVDNTSPIISNIQVSTNCINGGVGQSVILTFDVLEEGCGTFNKDDITIGLAPALAGAIYASISGGTAGSPYTFAYNIPVTDVDADGPINITINANDDKLNAATPLVATNAFTIDNTVPVFSNLTVSSPSVKGGDVLTITFDVVENGCGTFSPENSDLVFTPVLLSPIVYVGIVGNTVTYTVPIIPTDTDGPREITVVGQDDVGNGAVPLTPAGVEFTINQSAAPTVTNIATNLLTITDAQAGIGTFNIAVTYSTAMNPAVAQYPTITLAPNVSTTLSPTTAAWTAGNTVFTRVYNVVDAGVCQDNVDIAVSGGQSSTSIAALNGNATDEFDVAMCELPGSVINNIGMEANGISSLVNGAITNGVVVWKFTVEDDFQGDDALPTNVQNIVVNAAPGNIAQFNTYIENAAIYAANQTTKLADAVVGASTLTFNGVNAVVADNSTADMYIKLTLKTTIPAADGKRFVFTISHNDVTLNAGSTPWTTFSNTSSTNAQDNVIEVIATKLAYATPPTNAVVGVVAIPITVHAQDANNNQDQGINDVINLTTSTTTITAGTPVNMVNGEAIFNAITYGVAHAAATVTASTATVGLASAVSAPFTVSPAIPTQVSDIDYDSRSRFSISFDWVNNGSKALVVAFDKGATGTDVYPADAIPVNGTVYADHAGVFTTGIQVGTDPAAKIVAVGDYNSITVSGLIINHTYEFRVFAYASDAANTPALTVYNTVAPGTLIRTTSWIKGELGADVELMSFDAISKDATVFLDWETKVELDNDGFELHRAEMTQAGISKFAMIATYENNDKLVGLGKSDYGQDYAYTDDDNTLKSGRQYIYRLVSVASDGYKEVRGTRSVNIIGNSSMIVSEITPNPVVDKFTVNIEVNQATSITLQVVNMVGEIVAVPYSSKELGIGENSLEVTVDRNIFAAGSYFIKVIANGRDEAVTKRFVIVK